MQSFSNRGAASGGQAGSSMLFRAASAEAEEEIAPTGTGCGAITSKRGG